MKRTSPISHNLRYLPHLIFIVFLILVFWSLHSWKNKDARNSPTEEFTINIKIVGDSMLILEDLHLSNNEFAAHLNSRVTELKDRGISNDHIICAIGAKGHAKLESVVQVQQQIRRAGLNRLKYVKYR
jgi:biopolymer transport protein ExbD